MLNKNIMNWLIIAICIISGFISGWKLKVCTSEENKSVNASEQVLRIHDTIKTALVEYKAIPGMEIKIDSIENKINQFWKDSLKNLYGKGMFEAKFLNEKKQWKREINLESRIPIDPEAKIEIDEEIRIPKVYPNRTLGIYGGLEYELKCGFAGEIGAKYYLIDFKNFSMDGKIEGRYLINDKAWEPAGRIEMEVKF